MRLIEWLEDNIAYFNADDLGKMIACSKEQGSLLEELLETQNGCMLHHILANADRIAESEYTLEEKNKKVAAIVAVIFESITNDDDLVKILLIREEQNFRTPLHFLYSRSAVLRTAIDLFHARFAQMSESNKEKIALARDRQGYNIINFQAVNHPTFTINELGNKISEIAFSHCDVSSRSTLHAVCDQLSSTNKFIKINMLINFVREQKNTRNNLFFRLGFVVDKNGRNPLHFFCRRVGKEFVKETLDAIINLQNLLGNDYAKQLFAQDERGKTPLHCLPRPWNMDVVSVLLIPLTQQQRKLLAVIQSDISDNKNEPLFKLLDLAIQNVSISDMQRAIVLFAWPRLFENFKSFPVFTREIKKLVNQHTCLLRAVNYFLEHRDLYLLNEPENQLSRFYLDLIQDFSQCLITIKARKAMPKLFFGPVVFHKSEQPFTEHFKTYGKIRTNFKKCTPRQVEECSEFFTEYMLDLKATDTDTLARMRIIEDIFCGIKQPVAQPSNNADAGSSKAKWKTRLRFWQCSSPESRQDSADLLSIEIPASRQGR